jgi:hypothetical protein
MDNVVFDRDSYYNLDDAVVDFVEDGDIGSFDHCIDYIHHRHHHPWSCTDSNGYHYSYHYYYSQKDHGNSALMGIGIADDSCIGFVVHIV